VRVVVCHTCKSVVHIGGDLEEVTSLLSGQDTFACISPFCNGEMLSSPPARAGDNYTVKEVPIRGFYRAIHGFGTGVGDPASVERLRELLQTKRVANIKAFPVGQPERVIIREMVLEDGTRLHFETSARGACIYYIEERGPSCVEVVENELSADAAVEGGDSNREETGRASEAGASDSSEPDGVSGTAEAATIECTEPGCMPGLSTADHVPGSD